MTNNSRPRRVGRPPNDVPSIHWGTTITANPVNEADIVEVLNDAPSNASRSDYIKSLIRDALKVRGEPEQVIIDTIGLEEGADDDLIEFIKSCPPGVPFRAHITTALRKGTQHTVSTSVEESDSLTDGLMGLLG